MLQSNGKLSQNKERVANSKRGEKKVHTKNGGPHCNALLRTLLRHPAPKLAWMKIYIWVNLLSTGRLVGVQLYGAFAWSDAASSVPESACRNPPDSLLPLSSLNI